VLPPVVDAQLFANICMREHDGVGTSRAPSGSDDRSQR
jgi:hypothetical protein